MKSLSGVGLGLSVIFGCLVLALVAELYYLLWWKKRIITNRRIEERHSCNSPAKELLYMFCLKKPTSIVGQQEICSSSVVDGVQNHQVMVQVQSSSSRSSSSSSGSDTKETNLVESEEETMEAELMRLHKIAGPPRFLFTIVEETKEDLLEFEDGKGSRGKCLSELLVTIETPFLTPTASPSLFTPPLTPTGGSSYRQYGFNPMFESSTDAEFIQMTAPSPPPKFKFLQDAEEKLRRKRMVDLEESAVAADEEDG